MNFDELLDYFKEKGISIQLTLTVNEPPTAHALFVHNNKSKFLKTEHSTLKGTLILMKHKYEKLIKKEEI